MLHVPGMPEGVHVSFSPEHLPVSVPAPTELVGAGTPSKELAALLEAHEMAYGYALYTEAYGLPDLAERRQAEEEAFRALLHTPLQSDADRAAYAAAVISRQIHSLGNGVISGRDHPLAVAYRNIRLGEHAREPEEMRHVGRKAEPGTSADPILAAIKAHRDAYATWYPLMVAWSDTFDGTAEYDAAKAIDADARQREQDAFRSVLSTRPTTPGGLAALAAYLPDAMRQADPDTDVQALAALDALRDGARCLTVAAANAAPLATEFAVSPDEPGAGLMTFADASGSLHTKPIAKGLAFMAARLNAVARNEYSRRFNAECSDLDPTACEALDTRLRRELRLDALDILAFRFEQAFAEGHARRGGALARLSAEQIDLTALDVFQLSGLFEAYQVARFSWEGVEQRPYSYERGADRLRHMTELGKVARFEEERAAWIIDRIEREIVSRKPEDEEQRDEILMVRTQQEFRCNARIHDNALLADIARDWTV